MERIELKPEKEQMVMWFIGWGIPAVIGVIIWSLIILYVPATEVPKFVWILCLAAFAIVMAPIAIWIPAFYRSLKYAIENDCIKMVKGVFWKKNITVPFTKITNVDVTQGPLQRLFNIGTINVQTAGAGGAQGARPELVFVGIRDLEGIKETIMERVRGRIAKSDEEPEETLPDKKQPEVLSQILQELSTIRQLLEKRGQG